MEELQPQKQTGQFNKWDHHREKRVENNDADIVFLKLNLKKILKCKKLLLVQKEQRYVDLVSILQTEPPTLPTERKIGSISWDSVTRSIRSWKGTVTLSQ